MGKRPLIVVAEDEALVGLDLCDDLVEAGFEVLGPTNSVAGALLLLDEKVPAAAIVDVRLRDGHCVDLVRRLRQLGVPFLIYSGFRPNEAMEADLDGSPWIGKPASFQAILDCLTALITVPSQPRSERTSDRE